MRYWLVLRRMVCGRTNLMDGQTYKIHCFRISPSNLQLSLPLIDTGVFFLGYWGIDGGLWLCPFSVSSILSFIYSLMRSLSLILVVQYYSLFYNCGAAWVVKLFIPDAWNFLYRPHFALKGCVWCMVSYWWQLHTDMHAANNYRETWAPDNPQSLFFYTEIAVM